MKNKWQQIYEKRYNHDDPPVFIVSKEYCQIEAETAIGRRLTDAELARLQYELIADEDLDLRVHVRNAIEVAVDNEDGSWDSFDED